MRSVARTDAPRRTNRFDDGARPRRRRARIVSGHEPNSARYSGSATSWQSAVAWRINSSRLAARRDRRRTAVGKAEVSSGGTALRRTPEQRVRSRLGTSAG
jgi:hypothetical protein